MKDAMGKDIEVGHDVAYAAASYGHAVALRLGAVVDLNEAEGKIKVARREDRAVRWIQARSYAGPKVLIVEWP